MKRVALYARVSTADQQWRPQVAKMKEWAERNDYEVETALHDEASGRDSERPSQQRIMSLARGHHTHAVAVVKVDRWARSVQHLSATVSELVDLGVEFHAIDQGLHVKPKDPTSKLILNVLAAVAEWEADIISERTRDALEARRAAGVQLGRPPTPCPLCGERRPAAGRIRRDGKRLYVCAECKADNQRRRNDGE